MKSSVAVPTLLVATVLLAGCTGSVDAPFGGDIATADNDVQATGDTDVPPPNVPADGGDTTPTDDAVPPADPAPGGDSVPIDTNPCTNGAAVFCDDFEGDQAGSAPPAPWTASTYSGTVSVSTAHAHSGSKSVKCATTASSGADVFRQALIRIAEDDAPITDNAFFGRMMVWFGATPPNDNLHWSNIKASGTVTTETYNNQSFTASYNYGGQYSHLMGNYDSGDGPASDCWQHSTTILAAQKWWCFEWQFDGPNDTMRFWVDGQAIDALTMVGSGQGCIAHDLGDRWVAPQFDTISLGWEHYQPIANDMEFYLDDVALGPARLGCPQ